MGVKDSGILNLSLRRSLRKVDSEDLFFWILKIGVRFEDFDFILDLCLGVF